MIQAFARERRTSDTCPSEQDAEKKNNKTGLFKGKHLPAERSDCLEVVFISTYLSGPLAIDLGQTCLLSSGSLLHYLDHCLFIWSKSEETFFAPFAGWLAWPGSAC